MEGKAKDWKCVKQWSLDWLSANYSKDEVAIFDPLNSANDSINYKVENSGVLDNGIALTLIFDESVPVDLMHLSVINSEKDVTAFCVVEGRKKDRKYIYRVDISKKMLEHSHLWIFLKEKGEAFFYFKQLMEKYSAAPSSPYPTPPAPSPTNTTTPGENRTPSHQRTNLTPPPSPTEATPATNSSTTSTSST